MAGAGVTAAKAAHLIQELLPGTAQLSGTLSLRHMSYRTSFMGSGAWISFSLLEEPGSPFTLGSIL